MATIKEQAAAIKGYAAEIDAAIVAKGGTTDGGLCHAAAAIEALPSGGDNLAGRFTDGIDDPFPETFVAPDSATSIKPYAFYGMNLKSVVLKNVKTLGNLCFGGTSIVFKRGDLDGIVSGQDPFSSANGITGTIYLPNATSWSTRFLYGSNSVSEFIAPKIVSITNGSNLFYGASSLRIIDLRSFTSVGAITGASFSSTNSLELVYLNSISFSATQSKDMLSRIPKTCTVHFAEGKVQYVDGAWVVVE